MPGDCSHGTEADFEGLGLEMRDQCSPRGIRPSPPLLLHSLVGCISFEVSSCSRTSHYRSRCLGCRSRRGSRVWCPGPVIMAEVAVFCIITHDFGLMLCGDWDNVYGGCDQEWEQFKDPRVGVSGLWVGQGRGQQPAMWLGLILV